MRSSHTKCSQPVSPLFHTSCRSTFGPPVHNGRPLHAGVGRRRSGPCPAGPCASCSTCHTQAGNAANIRNTQYSGSWAGKNAWLGLPNIFLSCRKSENMRQVIKTQIQTKLDTLTPIQISIGSIKSHQKKLSGSKLGGYVLRLQSICHQV